MAERNSAICRAYEFGYCQADIAKAFGLSSTRIGQVLKAHDIPKRSGCIPPLVWDGRPMKI
jgi:hypothetical protein